MMHTVSKETGWNKAMNFEHMFYVKNLIVI